MHVECTSCHARYTIADDKIPVQGARVRCRKCSEVFSVERPSAAAPTELPLIPPTPQPAPPAPSESAFGSAFETSTPFSSPPMPPSAAPPTMAPFGSTAEQNPFDPPKTEEPRGQVAPTEIERFSFGSQGPAVAPPPSAPAFAPTPAAPAEAASAVSPFS